jgi:hypothetical protein
MSTADTRSIDPVQIQKLNDLRDRLRKLREAEEAELIPPMLLRRIFGATCVNQDSLAQAMTARLGSRVTQPEISRLMSTSSGRIDRRLQLELSRYFRSIGYVADKTGFLYMLPAEQSAA